MNPYNSVGGLPATGGLPQNNDVVPSFIYLFAYLILLAIVGLRFGIRRFRYHSLLYPIFFVVIRVVSYILRLIIGFRDRNGRTTSTNLYIAEIVLFDAGLPLLVLACYSTITGRLMYPSYEKNAGHRVFLRVTRVLIIVPLALLVAAGVIVVLRYPATNRVKIMRQVAYYFLIALSLVPLTMALVVACTNFNDTGVALPYLLLSLFLNMVCVGLAAWHLCEVYSNPGDTINSLRIFYVAPCLLETVAVMWFGITDLKTLFVSDSVVVDDDDKE